MILDNPQFLILLPFAVIPLALLLKRTRYAYLLGFSRSLILFLLVAAAVSPVITAEKTVETNKDAKILVDNTTSMQAVKALSAPEGSETEVFAEGNTSDIFSLASASLERNRRHLIFTDARTDESIDPLIEKAEGLNSSVSVLIPESRDEAAVRIEGPERTVPGAENQFRVEVSSTIDTAVPLEVYLNNEKIFEGRVEEGHEFTHVFDEKGENFLNASVRVEDSIKRNNNYYKTVEVAEKPHLLTIGQKASLEEQLSEFYSIDSSDSVPEDLGNYESLIIKKPVEGENLEQYLAEGNGAVYTGEMEEVPIYLPVEEAKETEEEAGARIILLIDASFNTGECVRRVESVCLDTTAEGGEAKKSVRLAYALVDELQGNNKVGVVAYNENPFKISEPKTLASNREDLKEKIASISPQGPSFHDRGLQGASIMANEEDTVVMFSDGEIGDYEENRNVRSKLDDISRRMEAKLISVGMGDSPNRPLLEDIAENTGGYYLKNDEAGSLGFKFGAGGGESDFTPLKVVNPTHFITQDRELDSSTTDFEPVKTKRTASELVSGSNGAPFLSTWRYGLGRVVAFSAGGKNLERVISDDPSIVSRSVSWATGNFGEEDRWATIQDFERPESPVVESSKDLEGFVRQGSDDYVKELEKPSTGLHSWRNLSYAYNYHGEVSEVGPDEEKLQEVAQEAEGRIFDSEEVEEALKGESVKRNKVQERVSLSLPLLMAALLIFLVEVGYRKRSGRL